MGHNRVMVVVDLVTKRSHFISTLTTVTTASTAPQKVVSDHRPQFVAKFTCELYQMLSIKLAATTAFHSQGDGQTEQVNQEQEQYLQVFINQ